MRAIKIRRAVQADASDIIDWTNDHVEDPSRLLLKSSVILCAENGRSLQFAAVHPAVIIECVGPSPDASRTQLALGLKALYSVIEKMARDTDIPEVILFTSAADGDIEKVIEKRGFQQLPFRAWRKLVGGGNEQKE